MSTSDGRLYAGVDVGARRVHATLLRQEGLLSFVARYVGDAEGVADFCSAASRVAIDAPGGPSAGAHLGDLSVAPKFRSGRCSEVPLPGVPAVPWVSPLSTAEAPEWMRTGFAVWSSLVAIVSNGAEVVETFPAAFFHRLHGGRWPPPKTSPAGRAVRLSLLSALVDLPSGAAGWGHDDLDAVACAVVAARGRPATHVCERPDRSVMWLMP